MAWLPAMLWLYDETVHASNLEERAALGHWSGRGHCGAVPGRPHTDRFCEPGWPRVVRRVHTGQVGVLATVAVRLARDTEQPRACSGRAFAESGRAEGPRPTSGQVVLRALLPLLAVLPALLLVAAQLLPSLELNRLGLRTGGLPFRQAVSFSLRPQLLAQSLLPPFGGGLADAFGSEGYAEFVAYVGITGLVLAALAVSRLAGSRWNSSARTGRRTVAPEPRAPHPERCCSWRFQGSSWRWARTTRSTTSFGDWCRALICSAPPSDGLNSRLSAWQRWQG